MVITAPLLDLEAEPDPVIATQPVGAVTRAQVGAEGLATASYDETMCYRFRLSRVWAPEGRRCAWIMLNPSTATEAELDPTVRRVHRFALAWGFGSFEVLNIFALRSTKPKALYNDDAPVGSGNDDAITAGARASDLVVCAWGVHGALGDRGSAVLGLLRECGVTPHVLALTKAGHPGHPLYLPKTAVPARWA